ncbi:MAG TPA: alpha/beta hydrolase [Chloroflexia bacterium]|nr:alpha/beta hydrolase [Chloroflexia bacterium]
MSERLADRVAVKEHDFEVNGLTLHAFSWGEFSSPERAVMLLHGLTANSQSWADFGPYLAERGYYALALDLRGRGLSDKPKHGYGVPFHANDILAVANTLGWARPNLVGHSMGATITLFLAALYPNRVGKVVLVDAGGKIPEDAVQAIGVSLSRLEKTYPSVEHYVDLMRQAPIYQWNSFWENYFRYDATIRPDGTVGASVPKAAIDEEIAVMAATRLEVMPSLVKAPTLITRATVGMLGPDKGLILPPEEAERLTSLIPGSRSIDIPDTNHYTIALSDFFKSEVTRFLD